MLTPRSIRRAAERKAAKDARRVDNGTNNTRIAANQNNAQLSTGPITAEGKAICSKNALKTGLTGRTVLLPDDDADRYARHLAAYEQSYRPADALERELVQAIADTAWRLDRIPALEESLYFKGSLGFAEQVAAHHESARPAMLRLETYLAYERQFKNLNIQERRLHSQRTRLIAELKQLQAERHKREVEEAAESHPIHGIGFEFSAVAEAPSPSATPTNTEPQSQPEDTATQALQRAAEAGFPGTRW